MAGSEIQAQMYGYLLAWSETFALVIFPVESPQQPSLVQPPYQQVAFLGDKANHDSGEPWSPFDVDWVG